MQITIADFTRRRLETTKVTPQNSGASLLKQVSRQLQVMADDSIQEWQEYEVENAASAGYEAGNQPNVTYQTGDSLTAKAFNKAASAAVSDKAQITATLGMNELADTYKNDPNEYQTKSDEFIDKQVGDLKSSVYTSKLATIIEGQMRLSQQADGYKIAKTFMATETSKMKASTEMLTHTITTEAFKTAGGVFSPDPTEQGISLNGFALSKKLLDASLHAVAPDGTPIYTAEGILARQQAFHSNFYSTAVQSWVSEAKLTVKDLVNIRKGTLTIDLGNGNKINILDEIGQKDYERKVIQYTMEKIKDKQANAKREDAQAKKIVKAKKDINDIVLLNNVQHGKGSTDNVVKMFTNGLISKEGAKSALNILNNPNIDINDTEYSTDLEVRQILGEDISKEVIANASRLSGSNFKKLLKANANADITMQSEDEKWIVREMVVKSKYGREDPKKVRLAYDMVHMYRTALKSGISNELAMEQVRTAIDIYKTRASNSLFNSVPKYLIITEGTINVVATAEATAEAFENGKITESVFEIEMDRIEVLINEKRRKSKTDG